DMIVHNSNIFDGIRWVLGEQSVKALRGSEMLDVIFNGTDLKEPLSMAEVTLTFDNAQKFFSVDNDEVAITRRIFRSGESEYLLNKAHVRLKDIMDLLMGTGIGAESYSLVQQGKIDLILSVRPEDRRLVFDEAAGITKYKAQKKEAMRKLEETAANLLRVNDIITEVKRQIGSLERQANKARRYKEVFEELKAKEINLSILQKNSLLAQKDRIIKELNELEVQELTLVSKIKEKEQSIANRQIELKALEEAILGLKDKILNAENLVIRNKEHILFNQERIKELESSQKYLEVQREQVKNKLALDEEKLNNLRIEFDGISQDIAEKTGIRKLKEDELNQISLAIKAALEKIAQSKKEILDLVARLANTNNEISDLGSKQQILSARRRRLDLEKAKTNEEQSLVEDNLKNIVQEVENLNRVVEGLKQKINALQNESSQEKDSLNNITSHLENLEKEKLTLESHREFIEKLKSKYEDISEAMSATVYLDKMPKEKVTGLVVKIKSSEVRGNKLLGEAKPLDLDTQKINQKLAEKKQQLHALNNQKQAKLFRIQELSEDIQMQEETLRGQDIALANKKANQDSVGIEFNKLKEESEIINLELADVEKETAALAEKLSGLKKAQQDLERAHQQKEDTVLEAQNCIATNTSLKEKVLVEIAQAKTQIEGLNKRIASEQATLKILEENCRMDRDSLQNIEGQL
ncbi:MAG: hypothetical protein HZA27_01895, partial [Candidatus Omnitrophica bacterium]|nr:hypothetical protein [Candidatus Omnitrophota bacterium]